MTKRPFSTDVPLACGRLFEPSRGQGDCWLEAYQHLVPQRTGGKATRPPSAASSAGNRSTKKAANRAFEAVQHQGGICA